MNLYKPGQLEIPTNSIEPFCLWAVFKYRQTSGPQVMHTGMRISHLTLRIDKGFVNKIRYSYPEDLNNVEYFRFLNFVTEWNSILQNFNLDSFE